MVRKCEARIAKIALMDVAQLGVRTRRRARERSQGGAEVMAATARLARKRKFNSEDLTIASSYIQLRSRRITVQTIGPKTVPENRCSSTASLDEQNRDSTSGCSSNRSKEEVNERLKSVDLQVKSNSEDESVEAETSAYNSCRQRREISEVKAESDELDSTARLSEASSRHKSTMEKMPTAFEIEEFFADSEKKIQKEFAAKYNFDIVKDEPLDGRYEWTRLKP